MDSLKECTNELERLFDRLNDILFNSELLRPIITIQTAGKKKKSMGWCTQTLVWTEYGTGETFFEINLCPEFFNEIDSISETLVHEMCHLYASQNGIKDTSRNGTYHNKEFKKIATSKYLQVEKTEKYGYAITCATDQLNNIFNDINIDTEAFLLVREIKKKESEESEESGETKKKKSYRYVCPDCGIIARTTKAVEIGCVKCSIQMIEVEKATK